MTNALDIIINYGNKVLNQKITSIQGGYIFFFQKNCIKFNFKKKMKLM